MERKGLTLSGSHVRPEPLNHSHLDGLVTAAAGNSSLYQWALVPQTANEAARHIDTALRVADAGAAVPFAIVLLGDGAVVGSTRSWNLERWPWPKKHLQNGQVFSMCVTSVPGPPSNRSAGSSKGFFAPIGWPPTTLLAIRLVFRSSQSSGHL